MRVIIEKDAPSVSRRGAWLVADLIRRKPDCVLGLASSAAFHGLYDQLVHAHRQEGLDFSRVTTFNLHEYVGCGPTDAGSSRFVMHQQLWRHINIDPHRTHTPDGQKSDFEDCCRQYEQQIRDAGGIDLQLLDVGRDGGIGFNEPGASLGGRTRVTPLTGDPIRDQAGLPGSEDQVPRLAISMGVGTILESGRCLWLALGSAQAAAVRSAIEGPVTAQVTASALQMHPDAIALLDEEAGSWLTRRAYYEEVERAQSLLEAGQRRDPASGHR